MIRRLRAALAAFAAPEAPMVGPMDPIGRPAWDFGDRWRLTDAVPPLDDLIAQRGMAQYREMEYDDAICSTLALHLLARVSTGIEFVAGGDEPADKQAAEALTHNFDNLRGSSALRFIEDLYDAQSVGFAALAKTYDEVEPYTFDDGTTRPMQMLKSLRPLPAETLAIHTDEFGDISENGVWQSKSQQLVLPGYDPSFFNQYPRDRFVLFTFRRRWNNPYGLSLLRACYRWWYAKKEIMTWQWRHLENFGLPFPDVAVADTTSESAMSSIAASVRRMIWQYQVLVRKKGTEVNWPTVNQQSMTAERRENIALCNRSMQRALGLPSLVMEGGDTVGSNALGQQHGNVLVWDVDYRGRRIEDEAFGEQVIREWHEINFGDTAKQPKAKFGEFQEKDLVMWTTIHAALDKLGMTFDKQWMYKFYGQPMPSEDAETLDGAPDPVPPQPPGQPFGGAPPDPEEMDQENEDAADALMALWEDMREMEILQATVDDYAEVLNGNGKRSGAAIRDGVLVR